MYPNGQVPLSLLVSRPCAGKDICLMFPGTAAKHDRLVALAQAEYGWTPVVSGSSDAYRTIGMQWSYWNTLPYPQAAYPGTSSHGGVYNGVESGAVDYGNWQEVGREVFFDLARRAGFEPGYFNGQNGRPDEPWHVIDWSPWDAPAPITPFAPSTTIQPEEDSMLIVQIDPRVNGAYYAINVNTGVYYQIANGLQLDALKAIPGTTMLGGPQPPSILDGLSPKRNVEDIVDDAVKKILAALGKA